MRRRSLLLLLAFSASLLLHASPRPLRAPKTDIVARSRGGHGGADWDQIESQASALAKRVLLEMDESKLEVHEGLQGNAGEQNDIPFRGWEPPPVDKRVPVTVVSGFLGSGKTSLMKHLCEKLCDRLRVGIVVNDVGPFNMDSHLLQQRAQLYTIPTKLVRFSNGCICCTLREDLLHQLKRMGASGAFDYILVESSGVSEPMPVAETFTFQELPSEAVNISKLDPRLRPNEQQQQMMNLSSYVRLDTLVTVVDASNFQTHIPMRSGSSNKLENRTQELTIKMSGLNVKDTLSDLLIKQIEFSDVVILNKVDCVDKPIIDSIKDQIAALNREAKIYLTNHSVIEPKWVVNTSLFSFAKALRYGDWLATPRNETVSEQEEYNISAIEYTRYRPMHPARFLNATVRLLPELLRSKGLLWLCTRNDYAVQWSQVGSRDFSVSSAGPWFTSTVEKELETVINSSEINSLVSQVYNRTTGDRRQQLTLIGVGLDKAKVHAILDSCLLTEEELSLGKEKLAAFPDPMPAFNNTFEDIMKEPPPIPESI